MRAGRGASAAVRGCDNRATMDTSRIASLFGGDPQETPAALAAALAAPAAPGHFDELRGSTADGAARSRGLPARPWARFFENLGSDGFDDLDRRSASLQRQIREHGTTYNVYADAQAPQRPWSLDLFPLLVTAADWRRIEAGVLQRVRLLDRMLADVYGPQRLLAANLLPPALVQGHPGFLRPLAGVRPPGGTHLHVAAFDLAHDPSGQWWVVSQRTQAPAGLGYLLENRIVVSRLFPDAFRDLPVQRLAATYRALIEGLRAMAPRGAEPRIVLLTPGPYNESYFEHAYLARFLGLPLVEGEDLTVRDDRLYVKTVQGLEPVDVVIKRLDDEFLDPLELRADSRLGVPGLLQAVRAGNVLIANAPGSAWLESPALLAFLPALARELLGEPLALPSLATWWCGDPAALDAVLPRLAAGVIKPTYAGPGAAAVLGKRLRPDELDAWARRLQCEPEAHTVQEWLPLSQMPTWREGGDSGRIVPRSLMLRVFAVCDGPQSWRVLPGGLARIAAPEDEIASMQRGGSSADTWVLGEGEVDRQPLQFPPPAIAAHRAFSTTSRAAESLFWLGRYTERAENTARFARLALEALTGEDQSARPLLAWLAAVASANGLVPASFAAELPGRRMFERALVTGLARTREFTSVGFNLQALRRAASAVRERLSQEQWQVIVGAEQDFAQGCALLAGAANYAALDALRLLEAVSRATAAMTGAQVDRMTRDDGWQLLAAGRHLERLGFLACALDAALEAGALRDEAGFEAVVALFDSTITFHAQYQERHDLAALLELLVLDRENPRSLAWVVQALRERLARLEGSAASGAPAIASGLPEPAAWPALPALCRLDAGGRPAALQALLQQCAGAAWRLADTLSARHFTHSEGPRHSVGA
jgi:uncharacterized circularly permuted ATP-grasp superfamily protein/uncharacterized alpha-E superfamily protein